MLNKLTKQDSYLKAFVKFEKVKKIKMQLKDCYYRQALVMAKAKNKQRA